MLRYLAQCMRMNCTRSSTSPLRPIALMSPRVPLGLVRIQCPRPPPHLGFDALGFPLSHCEHDAVVGGVCVCGGGIRRNKGD